MVNLEQILRGQKWQALWFVVCVLFDGSIPIGMLALVVGNVGAAMAMSWMGWVDRAFSSFGAGLGLTMVLFFVSLFSLGFGWEPWKLPSLFAHGGVSNSGRTLWQYWTKCSRDVRCDSHSIGISYSLLGDSSMEATSKGGQKWEAHASPSPNCLNENIEYWKIDDLIRVNVSKNHVNSIFLGSWGSKRGCNHIEAFAFGFQNHRSNEVIIIKRNNII